MVLVFGYILILLSATLVISTDMMENECAMQCGANDPALVGSSTNNLLSMYQIFNFTDLQLDDFCKMMNETNECYEKCNPAHSKYAFSKQYELAKFVCMETKFAQYLPCYAAVTNQVVQSCHDIESPINCDIEKQNMLFLKNSSKIMNSIYAFCKYLICIHECRRPALIDNCGLEADEVMRQFFNTIWQKQTKYFYDGIVMSDDVYCNV